MNIVILKGNVTATPDVKTYETEYGTFTVARTAIAVNEYVSKGKDKKTQFFNIEGRNKLAEVMGLYVKKGDNIAIVGRLSNEEYEKDGEKKKITKVIIVELELPSKKKETEETTETVPVDVPDADYSMIKDEDVPF